MRKRRKTWAYAAGALAASLAIAPVTVAQANSEKIMAKPKSVMVNTDTTVKGKGFPADTMIRLEECGATFWLAPKDPCDTENAQTVETNAKGKFTSSFEVQLCPEGAPGKKPTSQICFIGVPRFGEDTGTLEPAAKVTVTFP